MKYETRPTLFRLAAINDNMDLTRVFFILYRYEIHREIGAKNMTQKFLLQNRLLFCRTWEEKLAVFS